MIRIASFGGLNGYEKPGIVVRDHFGREPGCAVERHRGIGLLRSLSDTKIEAGSEFPMHQHQDVEIVTYVCQGWLTHEDSLGNRRTLGPGAVQAMTAGLGILHSVSNQGTAAVRIYQFWIEPLATGLAPTYSEFAQPKRGMRGSLWGLASGSDSYAGGASIRADVSILGADLDRGRTVEHPVG